MLTRSPCSAGLTGSPDGAAMCLNGLGTLYKARGDYDRAENMLREALALFRAAAPMVQDGRRALHLGDLLRTRGQTRRRGSRDPRGAGDLSCAAARRSSATRRHDRQPAGIMRARRDLAAAEPLYREALTVRRKRLAPRSIRRSRRA